MVKNTVISPAVSAPLSIVKVPGVASASAGIPMVLMLTNGTETVSYRAILSSPTEALRTSTSPSPSTSVANTEVAISALLEIVCSLKLLLPSLTYMAILSS